MSLLYRVLVNEDLTALTAWSHHAPFSSSLASPLKDKPAAGEAAGGGGGGGGLTAGAVVEDADDEHSTQLLLQQVAALTAHEQLGNKILGE